MDDWKRHTWENIPEIIEYLKPYWSYNQLNNPMALWIELNFLFMEALNKSNESLIKRIFKEVIYYLRLKKTPNDFNTAVAMAFLEGILIYDNAHKYIVKYFPKDLFLLYELNLSLGSSEKTYTKVLKMYDAKTWTIKA